MEFRFIYVNIFCWTKYDRFRFERNVNTQGSKPTELYKAMSLKFEMNVNIKMYVTQKRYS